MNPIGVRKSLVKLIAEAQHTTEEEIDRIVRIGTVAYIADHFLDIVGRSLGSAAVRVLDNFYQSFLGDYTYVAEDTTDGNYAIRFYHPLGSGGLDGVEGVQLNFVYDRKQRKYQARLYRVTTVSGALAQNLVRIFDLED